MKPKIIFLGTSEFAVPILDALLQHHYPIAMVVTAPDMRAGRGLELQESPIKQFAKKNDLPLYQPDKLEESSWKANVPEADLAVMAAYGKIVPEWLIGALPKGILNIHPSLLPKFRGASPIQEAILSGESVTGTTVMLTDTHMDHGPILAQKEASIDKKETTQTLTAKLSNLSATLLIEALPEWTEGKITPREQNHNDATLTKIIKKENGRVDWNERADMIERKVRAYNPWPGVAAEIERHAVKLIDVSVSDKVIPGKLCIPTAQDFLVIETLQPPGKKPMSGADFAHGYLKK